MVEAIAAVAGSTIAALGFLVVLVRWLVNRGRNEQAIANSIDKQVEATGRNTAATVELAAQVGGLRVTLENHGQTLTEHHFRLKALEEERVKVTVERITGS